MLSSISRHAAVACLPHDLGGQLAPAEHPAPRASLPLSAKLQGQALSLGLTPQPLGAIMGQLSKYVVMHHRVFSSLFLSVARVGLQKCERVRCSRMSHPFLVELRMSKSEARDKGMRNYDSLFRLPQ